MRSECAWVSHWSNVIPLAFRRARTRHAAFTRMHAPQPVEAVPVKTFIGSPVRAALNRLEGSTAIEATFETLGARFPKRCGRCKFVVNDVPVQRGKTTVSASFIGGFTTER